MDFSNIIQSVFSEMGIEPEDLEKLNEVPEQLENLEQRVEELEKAL